MSKEALAEFQKTLQAVFGEGNTLIDFSQVSSEILEKAPTLQADISLEDFAKTLTNCMDCRMHIGRGRICFGRGNPKAAVWFVGDFPSVEDDKAGSVFSGEVGDLLGKMISAMKLRSEDVYFANLFKCRRPEGLKIGEAEIDSCAKHFSKQWNYGRPANLVALGEFPARFFARSSLPLQTLRGQNHTWETSALYCTHHPRDLLQNPNLKKDCWNDLQRVMKAMGNA